MKNKDVITLFNMISVNTHVTINGAKGSIEVAEEHIESS